MKLLRRVQNWDISLAATFSLLIAVCAAFSSYYLVIIGPDTIVAYMASLEKWTPFFWGQDRYGMLIPLLTLPISNPFYNIVLQNILHILTSVGAFFVLSRFLFSDDHWLEAGMLSLLLFIGLNGAQDAKEFLCPWQIYGPGLFFGLLALVWAPQNVVLALLFAVLGAWSNFAMNALLGLLLLAVTLDRAAREGWEAHLRPFLRQGGVLLVSVMIGEGIRYPYRTSFSSQYSFLGAFDALIGWVRLFDDHAKAQGASLMVAILPAAFLISALIFSSRARLHGVRATWRAGLAALVAALWYTMIVGASEFARTNGYPRRYLAPLWIFWLVAVSGILVHLLAGEPRPRKSLAWLFLGAFLLMVARFGVPSPQTAWDSLVNRLAANYAPVKEAHCTHVAGDYYRVWDAVLYTRLTEQPKVWAITDRSEVTRKLWDVRKFRNPRICYWKNDEAEALSYLQSFNVDVKQMVDSTDSMVVLTNWW